MRTTTIMLVASSALVTTAARADEVTFDGDVEGPESGFGVGVLFGVGVAGFTDHTMRDTVASRIEGALEVRVTIGTRRRLALEINSLGTLGNIDALDGSASGRLHGTTLEAAARYNVFPSERWTPYGFGGFGWQRYTIRDPDFVLADTGVNGTDHSVVFPIGAGLSYRARNGVVVDLRGTLRINARPGLVLERMGSSDYAPMHSWETSGAIGAEF